MNAKQELLKKLDGRCPICAEITISNYEKRVHAILVSNHTDAEWQTFLNKLNVEYDNGYGGQELFGTVWLPDNVWMTRGEYDGSEWWEEHAYQAIPEQLKAQKT